MFILHHTKPRVSPEFCPTPNLSQSPRIHEKLYAETNTFGDGGTLGEAELGDDENGAVLKVTDPSGGFGVFVPQAGGAEEVLEHNSTPSSTIVTAPKLASGASTRGPAGV
ncbi:hypothetical protein ANO14919_137090 [Xylariales sp. No.14919]|nr:hypothetical protein ANO14919_137090 [Xylariales sp. No.14919]